MRMVYIATTFMLAAPTVVFAQAPSSNAPVTQKGQASFFNGGQNGHTKTASGEPVQPGSHTAASNSLPLGTKATVTNQATGKSTDVQVNDRGPTRPDRVIDLSKKSASDVGMAKTGTAPVTVKADPAKQSDPAVKQKLQEQANGNASH